MIKLGVLGSTKGTDLQAIFDAIGSGVLNAEVSVVLSNQKNAYILERAKNHNVPAMFVSYKGKSREEFDYKMTAILKTIMLIWFYLSDSCGFCLPNSVENGRIDF